jgi:hypothetical protein
MLGNGTSDFSAALFAPLAARLLTFCRPVD